jgi:hypothetical protein
MKHVACLCLAALALPVFSQQTTATLTGTVTDRTGAIIADVAVKAVNKETNLTREAKTDGSGSFTLPFLIAGEYTLTASRPGFRAQKLNNLTLQVGQTARVDVQLQVGDVTESVEVEGSGAILQTESSTVGTVIDAQKIVDLPLNGRNFVQLAQLIPGVQAGTPGSITVRRGRGSIGQTDSAFGSTAMSANGARDTANRYFLDGIEFMDYDAMTYAFSPSIDSIAEFKVETSTYSAESGGAPGGQVSMLTKRGSNNYHGTLWEFNRNNRLTSVYDAIGGKDVTPPRLNRNQFGANIGGPVSIPKLFSGKDKTFFFFNWESGRLAQGAVPGYRIVPPLDVRTGDFTNIVNARTGVPIVLRDPLGVGIANNRIPASALSKQSLAFLEFVAKPNAQNGAFNYLSPQFSAVSKQDNYTGRVDHQFSSKDSISGRYVFNDTYEAGVPFWGHDERNNLGRAQTVSATYNRIFSPSMVNDLRGGWSRFSEKEIFGTTNDPNFDVVGKMGLPLVSRLPQEYGPPSISISGNDGAFSVFDLQRQIGPRDRSNEIFQFTDSFSWQRGKHFIKMGADIARRHVTFEQARAPRASFGFDGTYTGSALADFMLGYIRTTTVNSAHTSTNLWNTWQAYYINDDWKATQRLTINFGLRYDYFQPYKQSDDKFVNIEQNGFFVAGLTTPSTSRYGRALIAPDRNNWGPRFGFAYRPSLVNDMVVRGGYGVYFTPQISNAIFAMAEGAQATAGASIIGNLTGAPNVFFSNPFASAQTSGSALNFAVSNDQNMRDSYIQQWNFNIQKKLKGNVLVDAGYVGSKGTKLIVTFEDLNRPIAIVDPRTPGLASLNSRRPNQDYQRNVRSDKSIGNSIYHALQMKIERRSNKGLTILGAYTWSKSISGPNDIGGQIGGGNFIGAPQNIYDLRSERAVSGFDVTQRYVQTVLYELPFFKGSTGFKRAFLAGWQVSTIVTAQSGYPTPVTVNVDTTGIGANSRPNWVSGQNGNLAPGERTWMRWFNTSAFTEPVFGAFGTSPRTAAFRLPGVFNADFSMNKTFRFTEARGLEFRTEAFNLFNHYNPDPATVDRNIRSATYGRVGGGVQGITTRVVQLGMKLYF